MGGYQTVVVGRGGGGQVANGWEGGYQITVKTVHCMVVIDIVIVV